MHTRRETAADILGNARKILGHWQRKLDKPDDIVTRYDGQGQPIEAAEVPKGAMVLATLGEEETIKMRAELSAIAATLEGLAAS